MVDFFALLNFPRTPWLDPARVQARFLELSAAMHPDRIHTSAPAEVAAANEKFAEMNKAVAVLRDHKERLHHLLLLETGDSPGMSQNIPSGFFSLSSEIGFLCKQTDVLLENLRRKESPMVKVQLFEEILGSTERVQNVQEKVKSLKAEAEAELQKIGANWPAEKPFERLKELAQAFAMFNKWEAQLQERFAGLAA